MNKKKKKKLAPANIMDTRKEYTRKTKPKIDMPQIDPQKKRRT